MGEARRQSRDAPGDAAWEARPNLGLGGELGVDVCKTNRLLLRLLAGLLAIQVFLEAVVGQGLKVNVEEHTSTSTCHRGQKGQASISMG